MTAPDQTAHTGRTETGTVSYYQCDGCGWTADDPETDIQKLRADGYVSCCPERKMRLVTHAAAEQSP